MGAGIIFSGTAFQQSPMFQQMVTPVESGSIFAAAKRILIRRPPKKTVTTSGANLLEIVAGDDRSCLLTSQNTVWCWGEGNAAPMQIKDHAGVALKDVVHISAGAKHVCALKQDGTVWCWGSNENGELGNGTKIESEGAVQVKANSDTFLTGMKAISAGGQHTCALKNDGKVLCWGNNSDAELGNASHEDSNFPVEVQEEGAGALQNIISISLGSSFSCGLKNDGKVLCWGQLVAPSAVSSDEGASAADNSTATDNQDDTNTDETAQAVSGATLVEDESGAPLSNVVSLGTFGSAKHICALKKDGTAWCFGGNDEGQFSAQKSDTDKAAQAFEGTALTAVSGGDAHTCVIKKDGSVWCRGSNTSGQLGDGSTSERTGLVQVKDATGNALTSATAIASGAKHACIMRAGNEVWCWGDSSNLLAQQVVLPSGDNFKPPVAGLPLPNLTVGGIHGCVTGPPEGYVWCWGGIKTINQEVDEQVFVTASHMIVHRKKIKPVSVILSTAYPILEKNGGKLKGAVSVSAGDWTACALKNDGSVWCWQIPYGNQNNNQFGALGDGTTNASEVAVQVLLKPGVPLTGITAISAGGSHVCALKNDSTLWCWGANGGALGNGLKDSSSFAVQVGGDHQFIAVGAGQNHTCAIDKATALWCWGESLQFGFGQGNGFIPRAIFDKNNQQVTGVRSLAHVQTADRFAAFQKKGDDSLWGIGQIAPGDVVKGPNTGLFQNPRQIVDNNNKPVLVKQASTGDGTGGHGCVLNKGDTSASCWGDNSRGPLGDGTQVDRQFPVLVQDPQGGTFTDFYQIESGRYFTCALGSRHGKEALTVWCWGYNAEGELGDGTTNDSSLPVQVKF